MTCLLYTQGLYRYFMKDLQMAQHGKLTCIPSVQQTLPRVKQGHIFLYSTEELLCKSSCTFLWGCRPDRGYCGFGNSFYMPAVLNCRISKPSHIKNIQTTELVMSLTRGVLWTILTYSKSAQMKAATFEYLSKESC